MNASERLPQSSTVRADGIMNVTVKRATECEQGNVLIMAIILLFVGGVILAPLLGLMSSGLLAGQVYEKKTEELYAADAGVEDAIWRIQCGNLTFDGDGRAYPEPLTVNDKSVHVAVARENIGGGCNETYSYQILSTATTKDGSSTTIDAHLALSYLDLSALLDNAIVSSNTIILKGDTAVNGSIWLPDEADLKVDDHVQYDPDKVKDKDDTVITWPTSEQLSSYYMEDVEGAYDPGSFIDIKNLNSTTIGPWYREGSLTVDNTGSPATRNLTDTIYVTGNLNLEQPGAASNYTINLNGQTVFAEGSITVAPTSISISGSGCIIAVGDINFQPNIVGGGDDFVLVMSITGETYFHPSGDFTGCLVGDTHVQLQPGCSITWVTPEGKGLNVPLGIGDGDKSVPVSGVDILSWEIS